MKIVLVNPNTRISAGRIATTNPPMGLLYIASYLRRHGYRNIEFIDADVDDLSIGQVVEKTREADIVGITMTTMQAIDGYRLAEAIKQNGEAVVVVGGAHPSGMREKIFSECDAIDYSVIGEGEIIFLNLVRNMEVGEPPRERLLCSMERLDPDMLPFPAVDLAMPISRYKPYYPPSKGELAFPVMASRGCPFRCKFCGSSMVWGHIVKFRQPSRVVDEVEWLHEKYQVDEIYYLDDTLNVDRRWLEELCHEQIRRGLHEEMYFKGSIRVNEYMLDLDLLKLMRKAGFWLVAFGAESGSQRILDSINKRITLWEMERAVKLMRKAGLKVVASFMIGHIEDDESTIKTTIRFAEKLNPDWFDFPISTPLPGTVLEEEYSRLGLIRSRDWSVYAMGKAVVDTKYLKAEDLEKWRETAFKTLWRRQAMRIRIRKALRNPLYAGKLMVKLMIKNIF